MISTIRYITWIESAISTGTIIYTKRHIRDGGARVARGVTAVRRSVRKWRLVILPRHGLGRRRRGKKCIQIAQFAQIVDQASGNRCWSSHRRKREICRDVRRVRICVGWR